MYIVLKNRILKANNNTNLIFKMTAITMTNQALCKYEVYNGTELYSKCTRVSHGTWSMCADHLRVCEPCPINTIDTQPAPVENPKPKTLKVAKTPKVQCTHTFTKGDKAGHRCGVMCDASVGWCSKHKKGKVITASASVQPELIQAEPVVATPDSQTLALPEPAALPEPEPAALPEPEPAALPEPEPEPEPAALPEPEPEEPISEWTEEEREVLDELAHEQREEYIAEWGDNPYWWLIHDCSKEELEKLTKLSARDRDAQIAEYRRKNRI